MKGTTPAAGPRHTGDHPVALRALTIKQPWASAVAYGSKRVENRTWLTSYRGLIAIHAGSAVDWTARKQAWLAAGLVPYQAGDPRRAWEASLPRGAVIAVARLTGCHQARECAGRRPDGRLCSPWAARNAWHWELADVHPLRDPVPCPGALNLWRPPAAVSARLLSQVCGTCGTPYSAADGGCAACCDTPWPDHAGTV